MSRVTINFANIQAMASDPVGPVAAIIEAKAIKVAAVARALILIPGSGGTYKPGVLTFRRGTKIYSNWASGGYDKERTVSAPGMPATNQTGELLDSISHKMMEGETVYAIVGSDDAPVAGWLSRGTRWMEARPFLQPALFIVIPGGHS
jgi:hypothetical protein